MSSATIKVHLLGREYSLCCQGNPDLVQAAAVLVEEKLSGLPTSASVDTRDRYMLVMLNLAGEYLREKLKNQALEVEQQSQRDSRSVRDAQAEESEAELIERIEGALKR